MCVYVCVRALQLDSAASVLLALASISIPLNFVASSRECANICSGVSCVQSVIARAGLPHRERG